MKDVDAGSLLAWVCELPVSSVSWQRPNDLD
jgi:hypothetical protein